MPFVTALSIATSAWRSLVLDSSTGPLSESSNFFTAVLRLDLRLVFRRVLLRIKSTLFSADLIFGNFLTSQQPQFYHGENKNASNDCIGLIISVNDNKEFE